MTVKNKWNGRSYRVIKVKEKTIVLEKENGEQIEIDRSEFNFSYRGQK
jgi:hypothetical protein